MTHATSEAGFWAELARVHWLGSFYSATLVSNSPPFTPVAGEVGGVAGGGLNGVLGSAF